MDNARRRQPGDSVQPEPPSTSPADDNPRSAAGRGSLLAQVREMSGAIGQRVDALEVQASQADELVAHRLAPAQFTAMARRQANTEMRLRHA